jgi:hypothetical protein
MALGDPGLPPPTGLSAAQPAPGDGMRAAVRVDGAEPISVRKFRVAPRASAFGPLDRLPARFRADHSGCRSALFLGGPLAMGPFTAIAIGMLRVACAHPPYTPPAAPHGAGPGATYPGSRRFFSHGAAGYITQAPPPLPPPAPPRPACSCSPAPLVALVATSVSWDFFLMT